MSSKQQTLDGSTAPKQHLSSTPTCAAAALDARKDCEWYCGDCGARVTISPTDGSKEYGHRGECGHRLPRGGAQ